MRTGSFEPRSLAPRATGVTACAGDGSSTSASVTPRRSSCLAKRCSAIRRAPMPISASRSVTTRRYDEGVATYRKAIDLDQRLWSARSQLAINLMRLGQEDEPRQQLELCYDNGYRDEATVNSLRLLDSYKNFTVVTTA